MRSLLVTSIMFAVSVACFVTVLGIGQYRAYTTANLQVPGEHGMRHATGSDIAALTWRAVRLSLPFALGLCGLLLAFAWPFAWFYRQGPREIAAVAGLAVGGAAGALFGLPAFQPLAGAAAGAVLFGGLGAALPRREAA